MKELKTCISEGFFKNTGISKDVTLETLKEICDLISKLSKSKTEKIFTQSNRSKFTTLLDTAFKQAVGSGCDITISYNYYIEGVFKNDERYFIIQRKPSWELWQIIESGKYTDLTKTTDQLVDNIFDTIAIERANRTYGGIANTIKYDIKL